MDAVEASDLSASKRVAGCTGTSVTPKRRPSRGRCCMDWHDPVISTLDAQRGFCWRGIQAAAPRSKTSTDMGSGSFTQSETLTADGSFSVVTVSSGSADSLPKRRCSDTSQARPRVSKGPFFFDEDDRHLNDTSVIAMVTEWGGVESSGFSSTTGSDEADFHANFCQFRRRRKSSAWAKS